MFIIYLCSVVIFSTEILTAEISNPKPCKKIMNLLKNDHIEQIFSYLSFIGNSENKADHISLEKYMTPDCIIQSNNEVICSGIPDIVDYSHKMQEKYKLVSYSDFLEPPILSGDKAVIHFQVKCISKTEPEELLDVIAILTFQNGKISSWKEVYHNISQ